MQKNYLEKVQQPGQTVNPLFTYLGVNIKKISKDEAILSLPLKQDFIQGAEVVAGGIISTLADEAMAHLVLANLEGDHEDTATIEMNIRFLKPIVKGEITAEAKVVKKGRKVFTVAAEIKDESGRLLAHAGASFMAI